MPVTLPRAKVFAFAVALALLLLLVAACGSVEVTVEQHNFYPRPGPHAYVSPGRYPCNYGSSR